MLPGKLLFLRCFVFVLWIGLQHAKAQTDVLKFNHITSENGLPQNTIHGIAKDKYGFMWFGTWAGLCRYDGYNFKVYHFNPKNKRSINSNRIHNVLKDKYGDIWILTFKEDELCRYNYETDDFDRFSRNDIKPGFISLITRRDHYESVKFSDGQFQWNLRSSDNSLVQTDLRSQQKTYYLSNPVNRWSLSDPYVTDLYKDDQNLLWVGTYNGGLNKANLNAKFIDYLFHDPANKNSLLDNNIKTICEDKVGNLWVGTRDKGITVIGKNGVLHFTHSEENKNSVNNNQIKEIYCDSEGVIWIGTKKGLDSFDDKTGTFTHHSDFRLNYYAVHNITEDFARNIWLATWNGVMMFKRSENRFIHFDPDKTLKSLHAKIVMFDSRGLLWVATEGGGVTALKYNQSNDRLMVIKHYQHDDSNPNSISDDRANCLQEDKSGKIWIGTGDGADCLNPTTNSIQHFASPHDLANAAIAGMTMDSRGYIWISHRKGLTRLNPKTRETRNVTARDGLQGNEFSDDAVLKSKFTRNLYFGGNNGLNAFDPDSIHFDSSVPKTVLTRLQVLNKEVSVNEEVNDRVMLKRPFYLTKELNLTYNDKSFSIEFAGLNFTNPEGNKYAYKLEGFDKDWIYTDAAHRVATYSNLDPGDYTFVVKSANSNGVWNPDPTTLKINVKPPFWASIYAFFLYLLIGIALLYLYHHYSTKFAKIQGKLAYELLIKEKEKELYQGKLQFFTNISHEIKTPLTLILAPLEKLTELCFENKNVAGQIRTLKNSGDRLLRLVNQLLDFRRLETGNVALNLKKQNIIPFIEAAVNPFNVLAEQKNLNLNFHSSKRDFYLRFDADKLEKVLSNLLSNAIRFSVNGGYIYVKVKNELIDNRDVFAIEVVNLGKEILQAEYKQIFEPFIQGSGNNEGGTGIGLAYVKSLVELHGGIISVKSTVIKDRTFETCFRIELPVNAIAIENLLEEVPVFDEVPRGVDTASERSSELPIIDINDHSKDTPFLINGKLPLLLVVEDNEDLRSYLKEHLEASFRIRDAENGQIALELATQQIPDLIISDIMMPEMDGIEFCKRVKTGTETAHIPVILLTAKAPVESQIEGFETGADDYIIKPFNLNLLTTRIKNLLLSRVQLKEKYRKAISFEPTENIPVSPDEKLLQKVLKYVEDHIADPSLSVENISTEIGLSRAQLYRKIKALTGLSMADVVKEIRFKRAKQLLKDRKFNVNEVVYMVGFSDVDYFRKCFKAEFGITPSEYYKNKSVDVS